MGETTNSRGWALTDSGVAVLSNQSDEHGRRYALACCTNELQPIAGYVPDRERRLEAMRLLLAAPDMLDALEELWERAQYWAVKAVADGVPDELRAKVLGALALAKGEAAP